MHREEAEETRSDKGSACVSTSQQVVAALKQLSEVRQRAWKDTSSSPPCLFSSAKCDSGRRLVKKACSHKWLKKAKQWLQLPLREKEKKKPSMLAPFITVVFSFSLCLFFLYELLFTWPKSDHFRKCCITHAAGGAYTTKCQWRQKRILFFCLVYCNFHLLHILSLQTFVFNSLIFCLFVVWHWLGICTVQFSCIALLMYELFFLLALSSLYHFINSFHHPSPLVCPLTLCCYAAICWSLTTIRDTWSFIICGTLD